MQVQHGNDEVLEKGNRTMKNVRDITFRGGDRRAEKQSERVCKARYRMVRDACDGEEAQYEAFTVQKGRQDPIHIN